VKYGGGGHRQAAGGVIKGTRQTVLDMLLQDFKDALDAYDQAR